jgi:hypothetical protein
MQGKEVKKMKIRKFSVLVAAVALMAISAPSAYAGPADGGTSPSDGGTPPVVICDLDPSGWGEVCTVQK